MNVLVFTIFMWALCCLIAAMTARNYCKRIDELERSRNEWKRSFEELNQSYSELLLKHCHSVQKQEGFPPVSVPKSVDANQLFKTRNG